MLRKGSDTIDRCARSAREVYDFGQISPCHATEPRDLQKAARAGSHIVRPGDPALELGRRGARARRRRAWRRRDRRGGHASAGPTLAQIAIRELVGGVDLVEGRITQRGAFNRLRSA